MGLERTRWDELKEEAERSYEDRPKIWELFQQFSWEKIREGHPHYSSTGVFERIRWETSTPYEGEEYKICSQWGPFYARRFMEENPGQLGFFRKRYQKSHDMPPLHPDPDDD